MPTSLPLAMRAALLLFGAVLSTVCFAFTIRADLGLGPLFAVQDGLAHLLGITIGQSVIVVGLIVVGLSAALRHPPGPGTLLLPFLGGFILDAVLPVVPTVRGVGARVVVVVVATWLMALSGAIITAAALGIAALDGVMLGLNRITGVAVAPTRLAMEAAMLLGGWWLGGAVGVGTVLTGLLIGPGLQFWIGVLGLHADGADVPSGLVLDAVGAGTA